MLLNYHFIKYQTLCLIGLFTSVLVMAQNNGEGGNPENYFNENYLRYDNHSYQNNVRTVQFYPIGQLLEPPVIMLGENNRLELNFDVLDSNLSNFMYTIIHCDRAWNASNLDPQEYIEGNAEDYLTEYSYSRNTFQKFVHYRLEIPNDNLVLTKSGNYLIKVYEQGEPDHLILTRRFSVAERLLNVNANIHQPTQVTERNSHQEVDFTINTAEYDLTNPFRDLHVVLMQNHSWESTIIGLQPRFIKDQLFDYDYDMGNAFLGTNEFRLLDIKNTRFAGQGVERITFNNQENHAYKILEKSRGAQVYLEKRDLNGWYFIKNDRLTTDPSLDADYVHVHFQIAQSKALEMGDVYVYGALTDWQIKPEAKMKFNQLSLAYECTMYLKQGLYNYFYVMVKDGEIKPDIAWFEGSHFQTENEYAIYVYHRQLGWDYDRLVSYTVYKFPPQ